MKICANCETLFESIGRQTYCSRSCRSRAYIRRHPDRRKATLDAWWRKLRADPVRYAVFLTQGRESYARHPETASIYAASWRGANRERVRENVLRQQAERNALKKGAPRAAIKEYIAILKLDPCVYCGNRAGCIDHIVALVCGGRHDPENLAAACRSCNARKRSKSLLHFLLAR